jgi:squalene-associated FAD-dependent desaturase
VTIRGRHVAVVGGGLAGISAALSCAEKGARVTLVERRRRLGGLTWSFEHNGMQVDNGQHVYLACCDAYIGLLGRLGSAGDVEAPRPLDIPVVAPAGHPGGSPLVGRLRRSGLPAPAHLAGSLLRYPHLSPLERLRLGRALRGLATVDVDDPAADRVTFAEWLRSKGQSDAAVAAVWDLITVPTVNLPAREASLAAAATVFRTGLLSRKDAADMGWGRVPLGRLHGERACSALARAGVVVRTATRVDALRRSEGGWEVLTPGGPLGADAVVVAVPHDEAGRIIPPGTVPSQAEWERLGFSAVVDVHLVFDRRVTAWQVMAGHRSPVQWVFDRSEAAGVEPPRQYLAVSYSAADAMLGARPEDLVATTLGALRDLLPAAGAASLVDSLVTKERRATFRASPGSASLRPGAATALPGLFLAGAWTDTGWPATMESAVRSGLAAAEALAVAGQENPDFSLDTKEVA